MLNLSTSDVAAWVQAIGSLLAIGAAFFIANLQHRNDRRRREEEQRQRQEQVARLCKTSAVTLIFCMENFAAASEMQKAEDIAVQLYRLREIIDFARGVPLAEIPADTAEAFISLRSFAAEALQVAESSVRGGAIVEYEYWATKFRDLGGHMQHILKMLDAPSVN